MESSRRNLLNDWAEHRSILKNNQNMYHPPVGFTPKTGMADFPKCFFFYWVRRSYFVLFCYVQFVSRFFFVVSLEGGDYYSTLNSSKTFFGLLLQDVYDSTFRAIFDSAGFSFLFFSVNNNIVFVVSNFSSQKEATFRLIVFDFALI